MQNDSKKFSSEIVETFNSEEKVLIITSDADAVKSNSEFELDLKDLKVDKVRFVLLYGGKPGPHDH